MAMSYPMAKTTWIRLRTEIRAGGPEAKALVRRTWPIVPVSPTPRSIRTTRRPGSIVETRSGWKADPDREDQAGQPGEVGDHRPGVHLAKPVQAEHGHGRRERADQRDQHRDVALPREVGTLDQHHPDDPAGHAEQVDPDLAPLQCRSESSTIQSG